MWILLTALAWADCTVEALEADLTAATIAAAEGQLDRRRVKLLEDQLGCTTTPLEPSQLATVHYVLGIHLHQQGDTQSAALHLLAAWEATPFAPFPKGIEPDDALLQAFYQAREGRFATERQVVPLPEAPPPRVDGLTAQWLTAGQPALVQPESGPVFLVDPSRPLPDLTGDGKRSGKGPNKPLLIAGLAGTAVSAGLYGGAWAMRSQYLDAVETGADDATRQSAHGANRALSIASVGTLALSGVLIGVSF